MKTARLFLILGLVLPAAAGSWAVAEESQSVEAAKQKSQADLEQSLRTLAELREQIAAEKLPLAKRLGELEQQLAGLRNEHESVLRAIDTGGFESGKEQTELKLRQEEVTYVGNLLDEYAKNLQTRLSVGEADRIGPVIEAATNAVNDRDMAPGQKIDHQLAVVASSLDRVQELLGGARFPGTAINPDGVLTPGEFAVVGPVAVFASTDRKSVGLALPQSGSPHPAVRPIDASMAAPIVALAETGKGLLPLDASLGGAIKAAVEKWNLLDVYKRGGPIMHPLLCVSILALAVILERTFFLLAESRKKDPKALQSVFAAVEAGRVDAAVRAGAQSKDAIARSLAYALAHRDRSLANALVVATSDIGRRFRRGIGILDTAITIAPLLGLLGTVTGMMHSFSLIGGDLSAPGAITGGIAEALIATAFGLMIAISCLIPFNYLNNRVDQVRQEMESAAAQLELLMHPDRGVVSALGTAHHAVIEGAA